LVIGAALLIWGSDGSTALNLGTVMGGAFIVFGGILAAMSQRYAKELDRSE